MQGVRHMGAYGLLGDPLPTGDLALQLGGRSDGRRGSESRPDDGDWGRPRARGGGGEEEEYEHGGLEEKVLLVAERPREGGVNRVPSKAWEWRRKRVYSSSEAGEDHQTLNVKWWRHHEGSVPDHGCRDCDIVLVRCTTNLGKPRGVGKLERGRNERGEVSLWATWGQGGRDRTMQKERFQPSKGELTRGVSKGLRLYLILLICVYIYHINVWMRQIKECV